MAAGDSKLSICSLAVIGLGEDPITSIDPPNNTKRAILANAFYDKVRRQVLRDGLWGCAKRQAALPASTVIPPFGWQNAYPLPADYLRMYRAPENDQQGNFGWPRVMMNLLGVGPCIVTNAGAPFNIEYIFDLQDATQMTADLVATLTASLRAELAIPLAVDIPLKSAAEAEREGLLGVARSTASQENSSREWDVDVLLRSRF